MDSGHNTVNGGNSQGIFSGAGDSPDPAMKQPVVSGNTSSVSMQQPVISSNGGGVSMQQPIVSDNNDLSMQQPVVPNNIPVQQPVVSSGVGDVVLSSSSDGGNKKRRWPVVVGIVVAIMVIVGAGAGVWTVINNANKERREQAEELVSLLGWVSYTSQCPMVVQYVNDYYVDIEQYDEYIRECVSNSEKIKKNLAAIKDLSGDRDYINLYSKLHSGVMNNVLFGEDLNNALNIYNKWHNFVVDVADFGPYQTNEEIETLAENLFSTNDVALTEFAKEWAIARENLISAKIMLDVDPSNQTYIDEYNAALDVYEEVMENAPDVTIITRLNNEENSGMAELGIDVLRLGVYLGDNL